MQAVRTIGLDIAKSAPDRRAMTIPVWVLLLFATWTLLLLFATIGYFRWSRILTGRATMREWRPDEVQGTTKSKEQSGTGVHCALMRIVSKTCRSTPR